jgi:hypothetical protein
MRRAKKLYLAMGLALVAMLVAAGAVYAAVTFDSSTGKGFVGKGDVQLAFGWNNAKLQANASGVSFTYNATDTYSATCSFVTGAGTRGEQTHNVSIPRHTSVNSTIQYDARTHKQIDGFLLTGFGATTTDGTVPVVGDACVANDEGVARNGTWSVVTLVSSTGGLYVNYGGTSVPLPNTPTV